MPICKLCLCEDYICTCITCNKQQPNISSPVKVNKKETHIIELVAIHEKTGCILGASKYSRLTKKENTKFEKLIKERKIDYRSISSASSAVLNQESLQTEKSHLSCPR